ncbi:MAG TPA: tRNA (adenosine(37)-N6)-threonylcarbamoyltransferase complex dimerization subunit type 1 TsaB [Gemmatimonadaceae bacterium]|nr:tRNA (adenosine(37)-N6)-threonylcarbamoyltransferase complex dimerization subunit type 1 TsaB [Gemmatimonadaceae bacterium]
MSDTLTLAIDASTYLGTVAVLRGAEILAEGEAAMRGEREERLMPAVADALRAAGIEPSRLARVVCGGGPGSFTSLRIAGSIAKGLCLAHAVPLFAAPSLALMVPDDRRALEAGRWLAVLDAMRGDVYTSELEIDAAGRVITASVVRLTPRAELGAMNDGHVLGRIGPAEGRVAAPRAIAVGALNPALVAPVSLATWEPAYGRLAEAQVKWEAAHGRALAPG